MLPIPVDIFTEPSNVASDDLANLGPLHQLAGIWRAYKGVDINPKAARPYGKPRDVQHAPSKLITRLVEALETGQRGQTSWTSQVRARSSSRRSPETP